MNNLPTVTKNLLIINVLCFFGMFVARKYGVDIENMLGLHFFLASDFNLGQLDHLHVHACQFFAYLLQYVCGMDVRTGAGTGVGT